MSFVFIILLHSLSELLTYIIDPEKSLHYEHSLPKSFQDSFRGLYYLLQQRLIERNSHTIHDSLIQSDLVK